MQHGSEMPSGAEKDERRSVDTRIIDVKGIVDGNYDNCH